MAVILYYIASGRSNAGYMAMDLKSLLLEASCLASKTGLSVLYVGSLVIVRDSRQGRFRHSFCHCSPSFVCCNSGEATNCRNLQCGYDVQWNRPIQTLIRMNAPGSTLNPNEGTRRRIDGRAGLTSDLTSQKTCSIIDVWERVCILLQRVHTYSLAWL